MAHALGQSLAAAALLSILFGLPALYILFSERFRRLPTAHELSTLFIILAVAGLILALPALAVLGISVLLAVGLAWLAAELSLDNLGYTRSVKPGRLFPGEEADIAVAIENRKFLPLAWLRIVDPIDFRIVRNDGRLDDVLTFSGEIERDDELGRSLVTVTALGPFRALDRTYRMKALRRGVYVLGPARAEAGDPFGIFPRRAWIGGTREIIVFPSLFRPEELGLPFHEMMGEIIPRSAPVEDPTFLAGGREYQPGDPLHRMNWKATARSGKLQVRVFDPSTTANLMIVLNLNTYEYLWQGVEVERMEHTISVAASLASWSGERGYGVGMRATGTVNNSDSAIRIAPSANPRQVATILDHLARLSFNTRFPPDHVLLDETRRLEARTTLVFVTPVLTTSLIDLLASRKLQNRAAVLFTGSAPPASVRGIPVYLARAEGVVARAVS